ncbi:MAG: hypothetical protein E4G99_03445 [Anaerolineales bacterium]|nr:MAG: hypothetical protein E4G99_03445 [Anaerolineales bacterium]
MMAPKLTQQQLLDYRAGTYRTKPGLNLESVSDAVEFINQRGFVTLWPIKGFELPNLWTATAGARPVASEHDDPGHITWGWKDQLLDKRLCYYAKLLRGKATFVSLELLPNFYALSPREADLDDYRQSYRSGTLSQEALQIADALLEHGSTDSMQLRRQAGLSSADRKYRFDRGLTELQKGLWILPIGVAEVGSWRYAFIYELLDRWFPGLASQASLLRLEQARSNLAWTYLRSIGASEENGMTRVFGWGLKQVQQALADLQDEGLVSKLNDGRWVVPELFESI